MTTRFTPEQLLKMADTLDDFYVRPGARLERQHDKSSSMLRQAASDVKDAERWRVFRAMTANIDIHLLQVLDSALENGGATEDQIDAAMDAAIASRNPTKESL